MSEITKRFIGRAVRILPWLVFCIIGLMDGVRDDSLARIITWSINIGMWVGLLINYIIDQIIYMIQKRTEQETEELPF